MCQSTISIDRGFGPQDQSGRINPQGRNDFTLDMNPLNMLRIPGIDDEDIAIKGRGGAEVNLTLYR